MSKFSGWIIGLAGLGSRFHRNRQRDGDGGQRRLSVQDLGDGVVRYWYNDGQSLPAGTIVVTLQAGAVRDLVGNLSEAATASFTVATATSRWM
jgi:hypothetical protein